MQRRDLEVFEHHTAVAVHDALGQTGGSRGVHHPERMVEGNRLDGERRDRTIHSQELVPADGAVERRERGIVGIGDGDHGGEGLEALAQSRHDIGAIVPTPVVLVAAHGEQHLGFDLTEPIDDALGAEVG